jgi:hypothetical protein
MEIKKLENNDIKFKRILSIEEMDEKLRKAKKAAKKQNKESMINGKESEKKE